jgi:hypothetical protein
MKLDVEVATAYEFFQTSNSLVTHSLDGHLLTDATEEQIAARFGVSAEVIRLYGELFFDVRPRINNIEYIAGFVIGPVLQSGIEALNTRLLCKYFGYFGGVLVLQTVLYGATRKVSITHDDEILGYLEGVFERTLTTQMATTAMFHMPSRFDLRTLIEGFVGIKSIKKSSDMDESDWITGVVQELRRLNAIPRGTAARQQFSDDTGLSIDGVIIEPRAKHKLGVMTGDTSSILAVEAAKNVDLLDIIASRRVNEDDANAVKLER